MMVSESEKRKEETEGEHERSARGMQSKEKTYNNIKEEGIQEKKVATHANIEKY